MKDLMLGMNLGSIKNGKNLYMIYSNLLLHVQMKDLNLEGILDFKR